MLFTVTVFAVEQFSKLNNNGTWNIGWNCWLCTCTKTIIQDISYYINSLQAVLSGRQLIFVSQAVSGHPPYFALRHDVDAVIWLPSSTSSESPNDHPWTHVNTFNALGYVQASKENRKFTTCPANLKFVAISDCTRHVFVYLQPPNGFRDNAALEFVHTLSEKSDILGLAASDDGLVFVLTSNTLIALKIPMTI